MGDFEWPYYTCKLKKIIICCCFCYRIRNRRIFCDRKRFHNTKEHIRRNGPSTSHYTSMHRQHYSRCNCKWHNQAASITRNKNTLFLDYWPKTLKNFLIVWKSGQENLAEYFTKNHSVKHHKRVHHIYLQTDKTPRTVALVLLKPDLQGCFDPADSKMEELWKTFPITRISQLRGTRKRENDRQTTERRKG